MELSILVGPNSFQCPCNWSKINRMDQWPNVFVFYTQRTWTSTMFVKKIVKLHSVACHLLRKKVHSYRFISGFNDTPKKYYSRIYSFPMSFTNNNEKWSPLLEEVCEVKYTVLEIWYYICFLYFPLFKHIRLQQFQF